MPLSPVMSIAFYGLFLVALVFYVQTWRSIKRLVTEARQTGNTARFNLLWWTPARRVHREAYPASPVRKQILLNFSLAFVFLLAAMACVAVADLKR